MRPLQMLGLGRLFKSKLLRRLEALVHAAQDVDLLSRAEWLRRAAEARRRQSTDPRLAPKPQLGSFGALV